MPYIYKITNTINNKVYIGKTTKTVLERWQEHKNEYTRTRSNKRPLYDAMRKYGIDNFSIEEIEECTIKELSEKEQYWISVYDSYHNGYNATKGGDGIILVDYDIIYKLYQKGYGIKEIMNITGCCNKTIEKILNIYGIFKEDRIKNGISKISKPVARMDKKTHTILEIFPSAAAADRKYSSGKHVADVCNKKRKSAGGFYWEYI